MELIKNVLNRIGTKAIVTVIAIYLIYDLAKGGDTVAAVIDGRWAVVAIGLITLSFFAVRYFTNDKEDFNGGNKNEANGTNPVSGPAPDTNNG